MAVRQFIDAAGTRWNAWNITPESIHPVTRAEDYLVDCFQLGWLVFETEGGQDKRRLCPYPARWDELSDEELVSLLDRAERVPPIKLQAERAVVTGTHDVRPEARSPGVVAPVIADAGSPAAGHAAPPDVTDLHVVRTFRYPGGRFWTVCVLAHPDDGGPPRLHFSAGMRSIDLRAWPRDWPDWPDEKLAELLRWAAPRPPRTQPDPGTFRRRWTDREEGSSARA